MQQSSQAQPTASRKLAFLHVDPRTLKPGVLHKVDVAKKALVELPPPSPKRKA